MATATYIPIATQTLSGSANAVTFSSIPSGYTDLKLVSSGGSGAVGAGLSVIFNGDGGSNYSDSCIYGTGSTAAVSSDKNVYGVNSTAGYVSLQSPFLFSMDIFSYTGSTYKVTLSQFADDNNGSGKVIATVGLWRNTSAITSLQVQSNGILTGTTFTLWGI